VLNFGDNSPETYYVSNDCAVMFITLARAEARGDSPLLLGIEHSLATPLISHGCKGQSLSYLEIQMNDCLNQGRL
jgi:hypothetical protein